VSSFLVDFQIVIWLFVWLTQRSWIDSKNSRKLPRKTSWIDANVLEERSQWTSCILSFLHSVNSNQKLFGSSFIYQHKTVNTFEFDFLWFKLMKEYGSNLCDVEHSTKKCYWLLALWFKISSHFTVFSNVWHYHNVEVIDLLDTDGYFNCFKLPIQ
jgi:hypothetical protein